MATKIDTSTWKPFRVGELFGIAKHKAYINPHSLEPSLNGAHIVSASMVNNGLSADTYATGELVDAMVPSHVITWGKQSPLFAYQDEKTIPGQGVYFYDVSQLSVFQALFVCACMQMYVGPRYNYQECLIGQKMDAEFIMLPATSDGEPDWAYMEQYMRDVMAREEMFAEHLVSLTAEAVADGHVIDTSAWKAFKVGDLFDVLLAKGDIQPNLIDDGNVPLVSAGTVDNGIVAMISDKGDGISEVFPAGCLTVSMFGTAFWQTETFYAVSHGRVNVLMPKCRVSDTVGLFLASAVNARFNGEYDYSTMCTRKRLLDATVTLPATSDGAPDWAYMEQYMKDVMAVEALFADELDRVYCA